MDVRQLHDTLDVIEGAAVRYWVGGGWGIDLLVGRQTREHHDLDLAIDAAHLDSCLAALRAQGFVDVADELPNRIALRREQPSPSEVDVHPVVFDAAGDGRLPGPGGAVFDFPGDDLVLGSLDDRVVPCLSASRQRAFHAGYEPREVDHHDLAQLDSLDGRGA